MLLQIHFLIFAYLHAFDPAELSEIYSFLWFVLQWKHLVVSVPLPSSSWEPRPCSPGAGGAKSSVLIWPHWPVLIGRCHSRSFAIGYCNFRAAGIQVSWWDWQRTKRRPHATDCIWQRCDLVYLYLSVSVCLPYQRVPFLTETVRGNNTVKNHGQLLFWK